MDAKKRKVSWPWSNLIQLALVLGASALLVMIIFIVQLTNQAQAVSEQKGHLSDILSADVSTTITLVRVLQGLLATVATVLLSQGFSYIQWGFTRDTRGSSYVRQLALSPTTSPWGTMRLMTHWSSGRWSRLWAFFRLLLTALVWLGGVILFVRTSLVVVFDTANTYPVTAGVGPFNASYVAPFFNYIHSLERSYPFKVLPYSYYGRVNDLITNSFYTSTADPIKCQVNEDDESAHCVSYLLSGGVVGTTPWIPSGYPDHPQVLVDNIPMIQIEFSTLPAEAEFNDKACQVYGSNTTLIAAKFCLEQRGFSMFDAGIFVCTQGIPNGECRSTTPAPNMTTSFSFYKRRGNVLAAKSNLTILDVTDLSEAQPISFTDSEFEAYQSVLAWLLDYAAADIPAPSSLVENFWSGAKQLSHAYSNAILQRNFRGVLVFPAWLFHANNYGHANLLENTIQNDLPPEFYTTASLVRSLVKIKFYPISTFVFVACQGLALLFAWVVFFWVISVHRSLPEISSFPLFDNQYKANTWGYNVPSSEESWKYRDTHILEAMSSARVGGRAHV